MCFLLVLSSSTLRQELVRELGIAAPAPTPEGKKPSKKEAKAAEEYERAIAEAPNHPISGLLAEQGQCPPPTHSPTLAHKL